jgi:hypothetical protein
MAQAVARAAFARPTRLATPRRYRRARATRAAASIDDGVSMETPSDETRARMARDVTNALFDPGGPLETRLLRLPVPDAPLPPALVRLARAREAPSRVMRASLHPRRLRVPDVEDALACRCELTPGARNSGASRFRSRASNQYVADLFGIIAGRDLSNARSARGSVAHELSRFDLFHAHVFVDRNAETAGLLFHAAEYPRLDDETFPHDLGFCQRNSPWTFDPEKQSRRNALWAVRRCEGCRGDVVGRNRQREYSVAFAVLDTGFGDGFDDAEAFHLEEKQNRTKKKKKKATDPLGERLLSVPETHATFEGDFGEIAGDVVYLHHLKDRKPKHRVFAFPR